MRRRRDRDPGPMSNGGYRYIIPSTDPSKRPRPMPPQPDPVDRGRGGYPSSGRPVTALRPPPTGPAPGARRECGFLGCGDDACRSFCAPTQPTLSDAWSDLRAALRYFVRVLTRQEPRP